MEERRKIKQVEKFDENGNLEYTIIPNYRIHENFMTENEIRFYKFLIKAVITIKEKYNINLTIFAQVALNRIIEINNKRHSELWENICDKSIDFILYDESKEKIFCCIELNDETHLQASRIARDNMIEKALKDGNVKIIFVKRQNTYNLDEMIDKILMNKKAD